MSVPIKVSETVFAVDLQRAKLRRREKRRKFLKALFGRKIVVIGAVGAVLFVLIAIFAPLISPHDPNVANFADSLVKPSSKYILGTDMQGRDILSRIFYGTRVSLIIGVLAVTIACITGTFLGMCAAFFGGWVDIIIMRLCEALRAIPQVVLAMALTAVFGGGIRNLAIILGVSTIPSYIMMMRAQVLSIKQSDYIMAGKLQGNRDLRLMFKHILPNSISPIIVMMTQKIGATILAEAGLSFLGLGISAPTASWGSMVNEGKNYLLQNPVFALAPGACVATLVISLNMFGDGIRDALDPRLRGEI